MNLNTRLAIYVICLVLIQGSDPGPVYRVSKEDEDRVQVDIQSSFEKNYIIYISEASLILVIITELLVKGCILVKLGYKEALENKINPHANP